jgi:hypothetical protein
VSAWQPIETAPRDGSEIILGSAYGGVFAGFWSDVPNYWGNFGWFEESDRAVCDATRKPYKPTHWQPLPAPPEEPRP